MVVHFMPSLLAVGALLGLLFAGALTPGLMPRSWLIQGLLAGTCAAVGYLEVLVGWIWRYLELPWVSKQATLLQAVTLMLAALVNTTMWGLASPSWLPIFRDSSVARFSNQARYPGNEFGNWGKIRMIYRDPEWLRGDRGPDVSGQFCWIPVVTKLQLAFAIASRYLFTERRRPCRCD